MLLFKLLIWVSCVNNLQFVTKKYGSFLNLLVISSLIALQKRLPGFSKAISYEDEWRWVGNALLLAHYDLSTHKQN